MVNSTIIYILHVLSFMNISLPGSSNYELDRRYWPCHDCQAILVIEKYESLTNMQCVDAAVLAKRLSDQDLALGFAEVCKQKVVYILDTKGLLRGTLEKQFLVHHEAFHVGAQIGRAKFPVEFISLARDVHRRAHEDLAQIIRVADILIKEGISESEGFCALFNREYKKLSPEARQYFRYKAYWEWPAELYAAHATFGSLDLRRHIAFRDGMFVQGADDAGSRIYTAGIATYAIIQRYENDYAWQTAVLDGTSLLDKALEIRGCQSEAGSLGPRVRIKSWRPGLGEQQAKALPL